MTEFRFAYPLALLILCLPLMVYWHPAFARWRPQVGMMRYSDTRLIHGLTIGWRAHWRYVPDILRWLVWCVLVVALARPQTGQAHEIVRGQGIDIVLALDISNSMGVSDFDPHNRLDAAKMVMNEFIGRREFDRIGLVVFAYNAFHLAPPTLDYGTLARQLDRVTLASSEGESVARKMDRTAIGLGLASSANMLRHSTAASKVIILLTDGDNNAGIDPVYAVEAIVTLGMRVYTVGMGRSDQADLNEDLLREIAMMGDGQYFRAEDIIGLQQIYSRIDRLERSGIEKVIFIRWEDRAATLLFLGLVLLLIERILRRTAFQTIP
jgi:Ca-activated chloride channel homolog